MKRQFPILLPFGLLGLTAAPLLGQGKVQVTGITPAGSDITLTLKNTASVPATGLATAYWLEGSPNMAPGTWATVTAYFNPVAGQSGSFTTTFSKPVGSPKYFYRAFGILGTATDLDGDGLLDTAEASNPFPSVAGLYDSDFDGFNDGVEFIYGSNPQNSSSKPYFDNTKPTVNFTLPDSSAAEGNAAAQVGITFDRPYSGTVNYSINSMSNTSSGVDYAPVSGTLTMPGNTLTANIPITLIDDANVSGQRVIIIDLKLSGENYFIGGRSSHFIILNDNDAWWTGTLVPASGEISSRIFRVKISRQGATTSAVFGAGAGNDGFSVPGATTRASGTGSTATITFYGRAVYPVGSQVTISGMAPAGYNATNVVVTASSPGAVSYANATTGAQTTAGLVSSGTSISSTSISTSIIPAGSWPGTGVVDSASQFQVTSPQLAITAGSIVNQALQRQLYLNAQPTLNTTTRPHSFLPGIRYVGDYTETLTTPAGALLGTLPGSFILMRDLPAPLPVLSKLVP